MTTVLSFRLPVLDTEETIEIVTEYMKEYNFSVFEVRSGKQVPALAPLHISDKSIQLFVFPLLITFHLLWQQWDRSSRRVWLGLVSDRGSGLMWADGQRVLTYPASSRLFVWEARR